MTVPALVRRTLASAGAGAGRARRLCARTPLRVRLVAALLVLVLSALVGAGVAATTTMPGRQPAAGGRPAPDGEDGHVHGPAGRRRPG